MSRAVFQRATGGRAPRVRVAGLVRLQFATAEEFLVAEAVDLSQSGMFIGRGEGTPARGGDIGGVHFQGGGEAGIRGGGRGGPGGAPRGPLPPGRRLALT